MNSVSGILWLVKDLDKTVMFYEKLGFNFKTRSPDYAAAYLNWFWMEFVVQDKAEKSLFQKEADLAEGNPRGAGLFVHISVENVDEFYEEMIIKGLTPASEPRDFPWGRREFVIRDPDNYRLVFFHKI